MNLSRSKRRLATGAVIATLHLARVTHTHAEEPHTDYRYQRYQEEDDRILVETHSFLFDVTLSPKVRLNGELVVDSISGATPSGAPAYKDWDTSPTQFAAEYAENNFGYLRPFFPDAAGWTNYINTDPGVAGQIQGATAAYQNSFTNSPHYLSTKTPATPQHEFRTSITIGLPVTFDGNTLFPQFSYSKESDYVSKSVSVNYSRELNDKNTTLNLGWSHDFDKVFDQYAALWRKKNTDTFLIGLNQIINPKTYATLNFTYGHSAGYLNDQYRAVYAANALLAQDTGFSDPDGVPVTMVADSWRAERRPDDKEKIITYAALTHFFDRLNGSGEIAYRFYHDTYDVDAHTISLDWHQKLGRKVILSPSFRYYRQSAAKFYYYMVPDYQHWPDYYSADYRLSEFESFTYGLRLTWRVTKAISLDLTYSRYEMTGLDGVTAESAYPTADVYGAGLRIWF